MVFQRVFLDVHRRQHILGGGVGNVQVENHPLCGGQHLHAVGKSRQPRGVNRRLRFLCLRRADGAQLLLQAGVFTHHAGYTQQEKLRNDIGHRQHFKIDAHQLLHQPYADVHQHRHRQNHRVGGGIRGLFHHRPQNNGNHHRKIAHQIEEIQAVPRAVHLFQRACAVNDDKGHLFVVDVQPAGACRHKQYRRADERQRACQPFGVRRAGDPQDDHQHRQRQEYRAEIGDAVGPQGHLQRAGGRQQEVAAVHHRHAYE